MLYNHKQQIRQELNKRLIIYSFINSNSLIFIKHIKFQKYI